MCIYMCVCVVCVSHSVHGKFGIWLIHVGEDEHIPSTAHQMTRYSTIKISLTDWIQAKDTTWTNVEETLIHMDRMIKKTNQTSKRNTKGHKAKPCVITYPLHFTTHTTKLVLFFMATWLLNSTTNIVLLYIHTYIHTYTHQDKIILLSRFTIHHL